jgi:hypothetical protein
MNINKFIFYRTSIWTVEPTQSHIQWGFGFFSLGINRPGLDVDHLLPSSAEVKTDLSYTSALPLRLLVVERENFIQ